MANFGNLQCTEFTCADLLDKDARLKLVDGFVMQLCKTAVLSFFDDETDKVTSWLQAQTYIIELQDVGTINTKRALDLSMFVTTYMNNQGKGVNDNGKSERRRDVDSGCNTTRASRNGKGEERNDDRY